MLWLPSAGSGTWLRWNPESTGCLQKIPTTKHPLINTTAHRKIPSLAPKNDPLLSPGATVASAKSLHPEISCVIVLSDMTFAMPIKPKKWLFFLFLNLHFMGLECRADERNKGF